MYGDQPILVKGTHNTETLETFQGILSFLRSTFSLLTLLSKVIFWRYEPIKKTSLDSFYSLLHFVNEDRDSLRQTVDGKGKRGFEKNYFYLMLIPVDSCLVIIGISRLRDKHWHFSVRFRKQLFQNAWKMSRKPIDKYWNY